MAVDMVLHVERAAPDRDQDPDRVGGEQQQHELEPSAAQAAALHQEEQDRGQQVAAENAIEPLHFPERALPRQ
jgi:hypothetical protein